MKHKRIHTQTYGSYNCQIVLIYNDNSIWYKFDKVPLVSEVGEYIHIYRPCNYIENYYEYFKINHVLKEDNLFKIIGNEDASVKKCVTCNKEKTSDDKFEFNKKNGVMTFWDFKGFVPL